MNKPTIRSAEVLERVAIRREEARLLRRSRKSERLDHSAQLILSGDRVNCWYGADEFAAMKLPGLPTSGPGIRRRAQNEKWVSRPVKGQGGKKGIKTEYFLPVFYRATLAAPLQATEEVVVSVKRGATPLATNSIQMTLEVSLEDAACITRWLAKRVKSQKALGGKE